MFHRFGREPGRSEEDGNQGGPVATNQEFEKAKRIFDQAADLPLDERTAFVEASCGSSERIRNNVERMLAEFESDEQPLCALTARPTNSGGSAEEGGFTGTERFIVRRRLGSGAFGTVYEAYDRERKATIALKLLERCKPDSLFRFKREFRSLISMRHENLVHLYELISEGGRWFFTMEFIDGVDFIEYVRAQRSSCDFVRLREALHQLALAVDALHAANHLHRDLKPGNVLVTNSGRVVVLDFGLVKQLREGGAEQTLISMVGTPAYMSPEQTNHSSVSAASDWYSVGVMVFQALTGQLPHSSSLVQRWLSNSETRVIEPKVLAPDVPLDLNALCCRLLDHVPENRPSANDVLQAVVGRQEMGVSHELTGARKSAEAFLGRVEEVRELRSAFADTLSGRINIVLIEGKSGIGKTTLVRHFLSSLRNDHPNLLALIGRCYEFESVPYKGLDALIDELSQHLQRLPDTKVEALLPRDVFLLPKLFPVLGRVKAIGSAPVLSAMVPDAQELRQRTFAALRELFARLADRKPVVIWIDDLQWGDRDSSSFLAELCAPPLQPPLLLLLTYRNEEISSNTTLQYIGRMFVGNQKVLGNWRHLVLTGLTEQESLALLRNYLAAKTKEHVAAKIVEEAQGHPLFLQELARFVSSTTDLSSADPADVDLRSFLRRRVDGMPAVPRELLELISIAVQPIAVSTLFAASSISEADDPLESLALLIRENLVRTSGGEGERRAEPFHDQVRSVVVESMLPDVRKIRHTQLASGLAARPDSEPQALVIHYQEAGDLGAAFEAALIAAGTAERQLAFDRAAMFYQAAIEADAVEGVRKKDLFVKLADCLSKAGRGKDAANAYLNAATRSGRDPFEMRRLAADQLMRSGYIDDAMKLFRELSEQIGMPIPNTPGMAIRGMIVGRVRARLRLLRGLPKPVSGKMPVNQVARLEVVRTGAVTLEIIDPVSAAYFQVKYVSEALRTHGPKQLATAFALEASLRAATGTRKPSKSLQLMERAEQIAEDLGDANTIGFIYLCRAYLDYLLGWVPEGIRDSRKTIDHLRQKCTGVSWELTAGHVLLIWFTCWAGYVDEVRDLFPQLLREGAARGDLNVEVSLRLLTAVHYYYLSDDRPDECLAETRRALERWSPSGFHIQHYGALFSHVESYLYLGDYARAREYLIKAWEPMSKSFILRRQILTIKAFFLRGRVALACWLQDRGKVHLRREVEHYAKRLKWIRSAWSDPMASLLFAGLVAGDGRRTEAAQLLEDSSEKLKKISLHAYASAAAHFSGVLRSDAYGSAQINASAQFLKSQRVRNPTAFLRMLLPGDLR
jgi:serine/threonine protein kinase/tetratricopeptide (TPR) repeat protein